MNVARLQGAHAKHAGRAVELATVRQNVIQVLELNDDLDATFSRQDD